MKTIKDNKMSRREAQSKFCELDLILESELAMT
jgi:hypothetical protein